MSEAPYHTELTRGDILDGAYRIVRLIAQGGMGYVYEAEQLRLERRVALKILSVDPKKSGEFLPRFRREAEICAKLSHPNIIAVVDWNVSHGMPYMVMEYLEGEDLGIRVGRGPMSVEETLGIVGDVVAGLTAAHAHGVVHRDLKPSNIFLTNVGGTKPHVKLLDFGVSKVAWETTLSTTSPKVLGSPRYMAPEQARGDSNLDARVDQFALAAVIYEMLSGQFAFDGESLTTVLYRVVHEEPVPLATVAPQLPQHIIASVARAMSKAPLERFEDVAQFLSALRGDVPPNVQHRAELKTGQAQRLQGRDANRLTLERDQAGKGAWPLAWGGLAVIAVALAAVIWRAHPGDDAGQPDLAPAIADTQAGVPQPPTTPVKDEAVTKSVTKPENTNLKSVVDSQQPEDGKDKKPPIRETAQVKRLLDEAQKAVDSGDYEEAVRRCRQALGHDDYPRARLIIAIAYCHTGNVGDARAAFFQVRGEDRAIAQRTCKARGIEL